MEAERVSELARELEGGDLRLDEGTRDAFSRDRSPFRRLPAAVLRAREAGEVAAAVAESARLEIPVTARAGGSSVAGQCLGEGLILDVSGLAGIRPGADDGLWETVWCGVGESLDDVNRELARHGRGIGPDVTSSSLARVGGLIGTNACGSRSLRHGRFADALLEADVVLADGSAVRLGREGPNGTLEGGLRELAAGVEAQLGAWPSQPRQPGGYRLPALREGALSQLPGSEGTLAVLTAARLATVPLPSSRSLTVASYGSIAEALKVAPALAASGASAVEVLDARLCKAARRLGLDAVLPGSAAALMVEGLGWHGEDAPRPSAPDLGAATATATLDASGAELAWRLRGGALAALGGDGRVAGSDSTGTVALAAFEDPAVAPEHAAGFCEALLGLLARLGLDAVVYGHAGAGCLHVRPLCDPAESRLGERLLDATAAVCGLVGEWGGALTGEHGWGLARSHLVETSLGPEIYAAMEAVKRAFDPAGILNPGMIVGGEDPRALVDLSQPAQR